MKLNHIDDEGRAIMVDITQKFATERVAIASGTIRMKPETLELIRSGEVKKGDVLAVARVAGIRQPKRRRSSFPLSPLAADIGKG
jgi:cyclic pyranopterin phosphate synthase